MDRDRLVRYYVVTLVGVVVVFTVAYDAGMTVFEDRHRDMIHSLEVVTQTFTTTGYGQDAPWQSTPMKVMVVAMQVTSTLLLFAALPVFVVPLVEEMLTFSAPTSVDDRSHHVVVCSDDSNVEALVEALSDRSVPYVVVEAETVVADRRYERGTNVIQGDPESAAALDRANAGDARAIVADIDDRTNLSIVMTATEVAPDVPVYSVAEDASFASYHRYAGADEVVSPRALLGQGLANKVRAAVETDLDSGLAVGEEFEIGEFPVEPDSSLRGRTVADCDIETKTGGTLIGAWSNGLFRSPPFPDLELDEHTVLLVAGRADQLDRVESLTESGLQTYERGSVVLVGMGRVGSTIYETLAGEPVSITTVDRQDAPDVDVVGDATDPTILRSAGVSEANTIVVALDDDTTALIATFVIREIAPDVEVIARANDREDVGKLYRAGASYVLAAATVSGRLLVSAILGEEGVSVDRRVQVVTRSAEPFAGQSLEAAAIPERTGCMVVAVEYIDGRVDVSPGKWTEVGEHDRLVLAGLDEHVRQFDELVGGAEVETDGNTGADGNT